MKRNAVFVGLFITGLFTGAGLAQTVAPPVTPTLLRGAAASSGRDWLSYGFTPQETRYSPLKQIDATNVARLGLHRFYELGAGGGGQEATPLVQNRVLYAITNWSVVYAIDLRTHEQLWRWDPEINKEAVRPKLCCGVVNRGIALYEDMIIAPINDGRLMGIDRKTGKPRWEARVAYPQDDFTLTIAPRMAGDKVIVGVAGGDRPTRGFFDAYDAKTGKRAWRFYTVPGDPSKPFEQPAMAKAAATWDGEWWKLGGGGAVWDAIAYDPVADLVYVGTGNAEPWPEEIRKTKGKDNLYVCSIVAVHASTGLYAWHYQVVPNDNWDYDSVQQLMLADLTIPDSNGTPRPRKVIMQASKNGFYYVIDRITGQFISGEPFSKVNWASGIDYKTGRPKVNPGAVYSKTPVTIFPTAGGAHNWAPMSFNPSTGLVYIPTTTGSSWTFAAVEEYKPVRGQTNGIVSPMPTPRDSGLPAIGPEPVDGGRGALVAWDPIMQKTRWRQPGGGGIGGGTVSTAGNLVFQVVNDGRLVAYSADKGEKLFELNTGLRSGMGPPMTYEVDGKQYVALMGGVGQVTGNAGPQNAGTSTGPKLMVFTLDGKAPMPAPAQTLAPPPVAPQADR